jgi:hypothetical protein
MFDVVEDKEGPLGMWVGNRNKEAWVSLRTQLELDDP